MGSDYFFRMGSSHSICQDYVVAGENYAIVSDGCSGKALPGEPGSPYTDFGARFLTKAAQRYLGNMAHGVFPSNLLISEAAAMSRQVMLPASSLDATLIVAVKNEKKTHVYLTGDGLVASRSRTGAIDYTTLRFANNAPYYLSYLLNNDALEKYQNHATVTAIHHHYDPETGWQKPVSVLEDLNSSRRIERHFQFDSELTDLVLIMSDGAESFFSKDGQGLPAHQVIDELFAIKGYKGEFLVRRCNKFLKDFADQGWKHFDDFGVAGIYSGDP